MRLLLILTLIAGIFIQAYYYSELPDYVANNFGNNGEPNSWMSREWHMGIAIAIYLMNSLLFLSTPLIFRKIPVKYINFPEKEFWLADERKTESIQLMSSWLAFFGLATNVFVILVSHLVYEANISDPVKLNESMFFTVILLFIIVIITWIILLFKRFKKIA